jgi:hypothetical protein
MKMWAIVSCLTLNENSVGFLTYKQETLKKTFPNDGLD